MTGMTVAGTAAGTLVSPLIANRLISIYSWRTSFTILSVAVFVLVTGLAQLLIRNPEKMGLLPYGAETGLEGHKNFNTPGISLQEAVRTAQLWLLLVIYVCAGFFVQVVIVHIVIHAAELGISPLNAASVLSIVGVGSLAGRLMGGSVSDRFGNKSTTIAAFILMGFGFTWLLAARHLWMLYLFAILFGLAYGEILCMMSLLPADLFGLRSQGAILGIVVFASTPGGGMGPSAAGAIFDLTGSYQAVFLVCIAAVIIGLVMAFCIKPVRGQPCCA